MLEKKIKKIIDINKYYSRDLSEWAEDTENLNDDALLRMLNNLLKEYDMKSDLLMQKLKFEREIYKKKRRYREKSVRVGVAHEIKKTKFEIKRRKKLNKKLYKLFKKKLKIDFKNEFLEKEKKFNDYCSNQKTEQTATNTTEENILQELNSPIQGTEQTAIDVNEETNSQELQSVVSEEESATAQEEQFEEQVK